MYKSGGQWVTAFVPSGISLSAFSSTRFIQLKIQSGSKSKLLEMSVTFVFFVIYHRKCHRGISLGKLCTLIAIKQRERRLVWNLAHNVD